MFSLERLLNKNHLRSEIEKEEFFNKRILKLNPYEDEFSLKHALNLRDKGIYKIVKKHKPKLFSKYLVTLLNSDNFNDKLLVYAQGKIFDLKLADSKEDLEIMSKCYYDLSNVIGLPDITSCGCLDNEDKNYFLIELKPNVQFIIYHLSKAIRKKNLDDFNQILFKLGSLCKTTIEQGYLYSTNLNDYVVEKKDETYEILPCSFSLIKHNFKTNDHIFFNNYLDMFETLANKPILIRNFKKGFHSH